MWTCTKCNTSNPNELEYCRDCKEKRPDLVSGEKKTDSSDYKPGNSLVVTLGRLVAVIFLVATIIFIFRFEDDSPSISLILIFTAFSNSVIFFLLSSILDALLGLSKERKY